MALKKLYWLLSYVRRIKKLVLKDSHITAKDNILNEFHNN
jgi:hypothetical protein